ncbi:MAG: toast rack family protein [Methanoregula sp.]|nr:toast rack family protein [Methanoregula sp.]
MISDIPKEGKKCGLRCLPFGAGTVPVRVILWLVAIAIVSFTIGFVILVVSGGFSAGASHPGSPFIHTAWTASNTTGFPLDGATAGNISVTMGAGELTFTGGARNNDLMELTVFSQAPEWQPEVSTTLHDMVKTVRITDKGHAGKAWIAVDSPNHWEIRLTDQVPVAADVRIGAGDCRLQLGTLNLTSLNVHAGAGDMEIDFSRYHGGRFDAEISQGIGDLTLRVPASGNTRITLDQGVGDITGPGFKMSNRAYVTTGFNPALPVSEIAVKQGVGDLRLEMV